MEEQSEKYLFEEMPVPKAVATLAIPTIISQVVTMIYNLADTFFIGQIGDPYMVAAVSLVSPWFNLLTALGNLFGLGGSSLISRLLCRRLCRFRAADPASVHPGGADQHAGRAVPSDVYKRQAMRKAEPGTEETDISEEAYTVDTKISEVINDPVFGAYGRLIFPVEDWYYSGDTPVSYTHLERFGAGSGLSGLL